LPLDYQRPEDIDRRAHVFEAIEESKPSSPGVDIVTIFKPLRRAKPSVTLAIHAHMFHTDDSKAAAINAALRMSRPGRGCNGPPIRPRHKLPTNVRALGGNRVAKQVWFFCRLPH